MANPTITVNEDYFYKTLLVNISADTTKGYIYTLIKNLFNKYHINKSNLCEVNFKRVEKNGKDIILMLVKYCKYNLEKFKKLDNKTKIRTALDLMGFKSKDIDRISLEKVGSKAVWVAKLKSDVYLDTIPARNDYEKSITKPLNEFLGFEIFVDFVYE